MNSSTPQIQFTLRTYRHQLALTQPSNDLDVIAQSTFQAVRSYYAATESDKETYTICREILSPMLEQLALSLEAGKIVNFMSVMARKAGLLLEAMKWNDFGLRRCSKDDRNTNALFILRNAAIVFSLSMEELSLSDPSSVLI